MGALTRSLHLFSFQRSSIFTSQSSIFLFSGGARKDLIISNHSHVFFGIVEAREPQLLHRGTISIEKHASIPKSFCKSKHITEHTLKDMFAQARTLELSFTAITKFIQVKNQGIYWKKKKNPSHCQKQPIIVWLFCVVDSTLPLARSLGLLYVILIPGFIARIPAFHLDL